MDFIRALLSDALRAVLALVVLWVVWKVWAWGVRRYPWKACEWCDGTGKAKDPADESRWGHCRVCRGAGKRRRFGAWLLRLPQPSGRGRHESDGRRG